MAVNALFPLFLLDVDNTLLDNDTFVADLTGWLDRSFGKVERERYWSIYERLRNEVGYADYLGAAQLFREGVEGNPALLQFSGYLLEYPFAERVYPDALRAITHLRNIGQLVILSDGDIVFQPRKIQRSGLWDAADGKVLIYEHKQRRLPDVQERFPAPHYVMVDDKPAILWETKKVLGERLTTVFVRQGHYAAAGPAVGQQPPDLSIAHIGDLCEFSLGTLLSVAARAPP